MRTVILAEDDSDISELVRMHLEELQCEVVNFANGAEVYEYARHNSFDLLVLDISLPGMNGMDICRKLRMEKINRPILMLTARSEEIDKVLGLESGADDYITKPFSVRELIARIKAIFRRMEMDTEDEVGPEQTIKFRGLVIDKKRRKVSLNDERIDLTKKEFNLLFFLAANPGITYDRKELLNKIWSYEFEGYEHTVNSHINRLRAKIEANPNHPEFVLTTWGVGYRFNEG